MIIRRQIRASAPAHHHNQFSLIISSNRIKQAQSKFREPLWYGF